MGRNAKDEKTEMKKIERVYYCNQHSYMVLVPLYDEDENGKKTVVYMRDGNGNYELNAYGRKVAAKKAIKFTEFTRLDQNGKPVSVTDWWCMYQLKPDNSDYDDILSQLEASRSKNGIDKIYSEEEYKHKINPEAAAVERRIKEQTKVETDRLQSELDRYKTMYEQAVKTKA